MVNNVPCKFYIRGTCNRGDSCSFYHGPFLEPQQAEVYCSIYLSHSFLLYLNTQQYEGGLVSADKDSCRHANSFREDFVQLGPAVDFGTTQSLSESFNLSFCIEFLPYGTCKVSLKDCSKT